MRYGIPFQASKNRIAKKIVDFLPKGEVLVDLFAGGCAVTHAAMLSGKWNKFIANDIGGWTEIFKNACEGKYKNYSKIPNREEYFAEKENDPIMKLCFSFGNTGKDYLWGKNQEQVKVTASRMLAAETLAERYDYYHKFIRLLNDAIKLNRPQELQSLERLERLQGLQGLQRLESLETFTKDYHNVKIPQGAIVYADPPYRNTKDCYGIKFDFDEFDKWINEVDFPIYISEYTAPKNCICVAEFTRQGSMASGGYNTTEKIFIQERFVKERLTT